LTGRPAESLSDYASAAAEISARYQTIVVLSLGAEGALSVRPTEALHVRPPRVTIPSAVGSGDCMLAGIACAMTRALSFQEAIRYGVAAGTANALSVGAGKFKARFRSSTCCCDGNKV